jgi:hypothetical protein
MSTIENGIQILVCKVAHSIPTSFLDMLEGNEVGIHRAPLQPFNEGYASEAADATDKRKLDKITTWEAIREDVKRRSEF